jgi:hypothetical protein
MSCKRTCCRKCKHDRGFNSLVCSDKSDENVGQCTYALCGDDCKVESVIQNPCPAFKRKAEQ